MALGASSSGLTLTKSPCPIGRVNGVLISAGTPVDVGILLMIDKIACVSTPAVPRSNRFKPNLVTAVCVLVNVCPGL